MTVSEQLSLRGTAFATVLAVVDMPALYLRGVGGGAEASGGLLQLQAKHPPTPPGTAPCEP